ncbi:Uncharacterised protein [Vibrio cholerae]|nr:Uncharacterised protein [Vibrio cholerae]
MRNFFFDQAGGFNTVHDRHTHIHQHHIRLVKFDQF